MMVRKIIAFAITYLLVVLYILWLADIMSGIFQLSPQASAVSRALFIFGATVGLIVGFLKGEVKARKK